MEPSDSDMEALMRSEDPDVERIMECVFGIHQHEIRTFVALVDAPGSTVAELAATVNRDRSNVSRSLSTLYDKGLIDRERRLLDGGGYVYQYFAVSLEEMRDRMHRGVDEWSEQVHETIDDIGP